MLRNRWIKVLLFVVCLAPLGWLLWRAWHEDLTANPIEFVTHLTGDWTIRFILLTLAVTPLRRLLSLPDLIRFRRMLGLYAFFYGSLHFLTWLWLDKAFDMHSKESRQKKIVLFFNTKNAHLKNYKSIYKRASSFF